MKFASLHQLLLLFFTFYSVSASQPLIHSSLSSTSKRSIKKDQNSLLGIRSTVLLNARDDGPSLVTTDQIAQQIGVNSVPWIWSFPNPSTGSNVHARHNVDSRGLLNTTGSESLPSQTRRRKEDDSGDSGGDGDDNGDDNGDGDSSGDGDSGEEGRDDTSDGSDSGNGEDDDTSDDPTESGRQELVCDESDEPNGQEDASGGSGGSEDSPASLQLRSMLYPRDGNEYSQLDKRFSPSSVAAAMSYMDWNETPGVAGDGRTATERVRSLLNAKPLNFNKDDGGEQGTDALGNGSGRDLPKTADSAIVNSWLQSSLNLYDSQVLIGGSNLAFVSDPTGVSSAMTLKVSYPKGSYVPSKSEVIGGTNFYPQPFLGPTISNRAESPYAKTLKASRQTETVVNLSSLPNNDGKYIVANSTSAFRPMLLLSYSVGFPSNFDFVKGGKLPGLYSSVGTPLYSEQTHDMVVDANTDGCSGGARDGVGSNCWSVRLMWREGGIGEIYAYFPTERSAGYDPCSQKKNIFICNDKFGTSIGRGSFNFASGRFTRVDLAVQLNSKTNLANGGIMLWIDGKKVIDEQQLALRTGTVPTVKTGAGGGSGSSANVMKVNSTTQAEWVDKVFFSTFFGGNTVDYATPVDTETYYKDFKLYAGTSLSKTSGIQLASHASRNTVSPMARLVSLSFSALLIFVLLDGFN